MFSLGGNKSDSNASSTMQQNMWMPHHLTNYYTDAEGMWNQYRPQANMGFNRYLPMMEPRMAQSYNMGQQGAQHLLHGGAYGNTGDIRNMLTQSLARTGDQTNTSKMYESIVGGAGNTYIDPMVEAMNRSSMENLDTMKNYGAANAAAMGQGGSSRHAMTDAMMNRTANQDMLDREMMMRGNAYDTDLNWKMDIAKLADQGIQSSQDRMLQMLQGRDQNVAAGMGYAPTMQQLNMGMMAPWMQAMAVPQQLMQTYGDQMPNPFVSSSGESNSSANSGGFNFGFGD